MRVLLAVTSFLASLVVCAQSEPVAPARLLTTTESIQSLSRTQISQGPRAQVRGVISFSQETWRVLFLQDSTGGIYCDCTSIGPLPPFGAEVLVEGVAGYGSFMPVLNVASIRVLGPGTLPQGNPVSIADLWLGKFDADLVRVTGHVTRAWVEREPETFLRLVIREGRQSLTASVFGLPPTNVSAYIGAKVNLDGAFAPTATNNVVTNVTILAGSPAMLRILSSAEEVIGSLATQRPTAVLAMPQSSKEFTSLPPILVRGTVRALIGENIWLDDGHQGLKVRMGKEHGLKYGQEVVVLGAPDSEGLERVLDGMRVVSKSGGPPERHQKVEIEGLYDWERYGSVVEAEGEFLHKISNGDEQILVLRRSDRTFEARFAFKPAEQIARLQAGSLIRVCGVLRLRAAEPGEPTAAEIIVPMPDHIQVLTRPLWPLRWTLAVFTGLSILLGVGLLVALLNYRRLQASNRRVAETEAQLRELNVDLGRRIHDRTLELERTVAKLNSEAAERRLTQEALADREARLRDAQSIAQLGSFRWDAQSDRILWSDQLYKIYGRDPATFNATFAAYLDHVHPDDRARISATVRESFERGENYQHDYRICRPDGEIRWVTAVGRILRDESGRIQGLEGTCQDITARKLAEGLLQAQAEVHQLLTENAPLNDVFDRLLQSIEMQAEGLLASILLLDEDGIHLHPASSPSLPPAYSAALEGVAIGPKVGSCGTAAYRREQVIVTDISLDPLWEDYRGLALGHGLRACWSTPILNAQREVLGTFAVYYRRPTSPESHHLRLIESATHTAAVCIERHRASRELRDNQAALLRAQGMAHVGNWTYDIFRRVFHGSMEALRMCGWSPGPHTAEEMQAILHPDDRDRVIAAWRAMLEGGIYDVEHRFLVNGEVTWVHVRAEVDRDSSGKAVRIQGVTQDISRRKRVDEALRVLSSSAALGSGADFFPQLAGQLAQVFQTRYAVVAELLPAQTGRMATLGIWINGQPYPNFVRDLRGSPCEAVLNDGIGLYKSGVRQLFPDDEIMAHLQAEGYYGMTVQDRRGQRIAIIAVIDNRPLQPPPDLEPVLKLFAERAGIEIERHRSLAALQAAEAKFRSAIENTSEGLALINRDGVYTYISPAVRQILGLEPSEVIGTDGSAWMHPADKPQADAYCARLSESAGAHAECELRMRHRDGSWHWIQVSGTNRLEDPNLQAFVTNFRDVTERKNAELLRMELEAQLRHSQKLEAVGTLAGGIAHDFNNILAAIVGCTELALLDAGPTGAVRDSLLDILKASHRARDLVKQILTFSRRQEERHGEVALGEIVQESVRLLRAVIPATVELIQRISPDVPAVLASATQIQQVIMNLATNAANAIGNACGRIEIELTPTIVDAAFASTHPQIRPGPAVRLSVRDNGPGIDPAVIDRIFEPFFTTKGPGQGTGLGLSVVHGIVRAHEGVIVASSTPGRGACFEILLPAAPACVPLRTSPAAASDAASLRPSGAGPRSILLVDDEPALLAVTAKILRNLGYSVTEFMHPHEAEVAFRNAPTQFDLVITDYSMPGEDGVAFGHRLQETRPGIPIIICTGHGRGLTREGARELGFVEMLDKPVGFAELAKAVRSVLDPGAGASYSPPDPDTALVQA